MKIKYHNYHLNKWIEMNCLCPCCSNELIEYGIDNKTDKLKRTILFCKKCNYAVAFDYDDIQLIKDGNKEE